MTTKARMGCDPVSLFQALGDETRYAIVEKLYRDGPTACGDFGLDCPAATLSHHFKVLLNANLIRREIAGNKRINFLNREAIESAFPDFFDSILGGPRKKRPHLSRSTR